MIGLLTKVNIIDNSGGVQGRCIKILNPKSTKSGRKIKTAQTGDLILISLTKSLPISNTVIKGNLYKALIVRTKKENNKKTPGNIMNNKSDELSKVYDFKSTSNSNINRILKFDGKITELGEKSKWYYSKSRLISKCLWSGKIDRIKDNFNDNSVVLVKLSSSLNKIEDYTPLGTRIKGPISKEIKNKRIFSKITSIIT